MADKQKSVEEIKHEIWLAERRLESLRIELKALDANNLTAEKWRLKLMPMPYNPEKNYWSLGIRAKASTGRETYVSVFADRDKQKVIDAIGPIILDLTELQRRISAQAENRKEEE